MKFLANMISNVLIFLIENIPKNNIISMFIYTIVIITAIDILVVFMKEK